MKGFFSIELLFLYFLLPNLLYLVQPEKLVLTREIEVYTQDAAQVLLYGYTPTGTHSIWVDLEPDCDFEFMYCTKRFIGGETRICAAECLH
ncbi:MAG: hypothetical protein GOU98_04235 [Candidatus Altiarchaeota archaeon]|nr:hypothetical protein [Candidatus Altiarchaeota archaeon]